MGNGEFMFARLTAKAVLAAIAIAMAFFGIGLLGIALAHALAAALGVAGGYAVAGAVLLVPPLADTRVPESPDGEHPARRKPTRTVPTMR